MSPRSARQRAHSRRGASAISPSEKISRMSWCAYVDESEPNSQSGSGVYLLAAALIERRDHETVRTAALELRLKGQRKLHWHGENTARRKLLIETVAPLAALHLIIIRSDPLVHSERRRAVCLSRLLTELETRGVTEVYIEAREKRQNERDLRVLAGLRAQRVIRSTLWIDHRPGPQNPLLWVPDVVAGAAGAQQAGDPSYLDLIRDLATIIEV